MNKIYRMTVKDFAVIALFFFVQFVAEPQELPSDEMVFVYEEDSFSEEEELPSPEEPEITDGEYIEPPEEPENFTAPPVSAPPDSRPLWQRWLNALYGYFSAPGETHRREPLRRFDWELFVVNADVLNNFIGAQDVLRETIKINMTELASRVGEEGVLFNTDIALRSAMNFDKVTGGFGLFAAMNGRLDLSLPKTLLTLASHGNAGNPQITGTFSISGAVFAETGFHHYFDIRKLRVDIRPSWFVPLIYIPSAEVDFTFLADETVSIGSFGSVTAYMPINLNESGIDMVNNFGGFDFSVALEYALFPIIDVGLDITHIPFMPSRLSNTAQVSVDGDILEETSIIDIVQDPGSLKLTFEPNYSFEYAEIYVMRPFDMNTWVLYRPFRTDFLGIKPHIGFTTNTPSGDTHFNLGLELEFNLNRVFFFTVRSGCDGGIWRHGAELGINLKAVHLTIETALASQDYLASWSGRGLSFGTGIRAGF